MDPIDLRLKNAAKEGTKSSYGPTFGAIGLIETLRGGEEAPALQGAARAEPGPRRRLRLLVQLRRPDLASSLNVDDDGTVGAGRSARPTSAASRASMA